MEFKIPAFVANIGEVFIGKHLFLQAAGGSLHLRCHDIAIARRLYQIQISFGIKPPVGYDNDSV